MGEDFETALGSGRLGEIVMFLLERGSVGEALQEMFGTWHFMQSMSLSIRLESSIFKVD